MENNTMNVLIPMAGSGSRFTRAGYNTPKPLIDIKGTPMIARAIVSLGVPNANYHFLIRKDGNERKIQSTLRALIPDCNVVIIDYLTEGPACSAILFEKWIANDEELIIANCDQIMEWNSSQFLYNARFPSYDGMIVTYHSDTEKNSYARLNNLGMVIEIKEKEVISNISLNGIHYWRKGCLFVKSVKQMINENDRAFNGEFYIGPSYNYMIKDGYNVGIYHIPKEQHWPVGIPADLDNYLNRNEMR